MEDGRKKTEIKKSPIFMFKYSLYCDYMSIISMLKLSDYVKHLEKKIDFLLTNFSDISMQCQVQIYIIQPDFIQSLF